MLEAPAPDAVAAPSPPSSRPSVSGAQAPPAPDEPLVALDDLFRLPTAPPSPAHSRGPLARRPSDVA